eukprot:COSAG01_NODE_169_length_23159_cov_44.920035_2_plen_115_part_00
MSLPAWPPIEAGEAVPSAPRPISAIRACLSSSALTMWDGGGGWSSSPPEPHSCESVDAEAPHALGEALRGPRRIRFFRHCGQRRALPALASPAHQVPPAAGPLYRCAMREGIEP